MTGAAALPVILSAVCTKADRKPAKRQRAGPGGNDRQQKLDDKCKHGERNQRRAKLPQAILTRRGRLGPHIL